MRLAVNGTRLYFDVEGAQVVPDGDALRERPVVLALHGGPGFDHTYLKPACSDLADAAQVVYLDQRGQGRSDPAPAAVPLETCTVMQMADDAAALCRALDIARPVVLAHSFGVQVAVHLALRHPDLVRGLIAVDGAAGFADLDESARALETRCGPEARAAATRVFGGDFSEAAYLEFVRLVLPAYAHPSKETLAAGLLRRCVFNPHVAAYFFGHDEPGEDVRDRLSEVRAPALVLVGADDWVTSPRACRRLAEAIPGAELEVIPEAGHFSFAEQPHAFGAAVRRFLGRLDA